MSGLMGSCSRAHAHLAFKSSRMVSRSRHCRDTRRQQCVVRAALDSAEALAVTQQTIAFGIVAIAETVYTRTQLAEDQPGRPALPLVAAGSVAVIAAALLAQVDAVSFPARLAGLGASGALFAYYVKRALDTKGNPIEWPGPKAWPAGMALLAFFTVNIFLQSLRA